MIKKSTNKENVKRLDSDLPEEIRRGSRVSLYWLSEHFRIMWGKTSNKPFNLPIGYDPYNQKKVKEYFKLKGFEYGNWLNQEDRFNYFFALQMALIHLDKYVLGFNHNVGLDGELGIAFGARGSQGASAHFEPSTFMINITRFKEAHKVLNFLGFRKYGNKTTDEVKHELFLESGGMGSLGHEYGHFLDAYFGTYIDQSKISRGLIKDGSLSLKPKIDWPKSSMRYDANMIIHKIMYRADGKFTSYFKYLHEGVKHGDLREYYILHEELFARAFEVYISKKLAKHKVQNLFLHKNKYNSNALYISGSTYKAVEPYFDSLLLKMRKTVNK